MSDYSVTVTGDDEYALAYVQELYAKHWQPEVPDGAEPPPPPTVEQMPQVLVDADLANRLREMDAVAATVVPAVQGITDPAVQEQVLQSLVQSPALQDYIRSKL